MSIFDNLEEESIEWLRSKRAQTLELIDLIKSIEPNNKIDIEQHEQILHHFDKAIEKKSREIKKYEKNN